MGSQKIIHCISNKTFHVLNCAFLIIVLIFQSLVLNTYIITYTYNWDMASYFWFLGDLFLAGLFVAMSIKAYSYLTEQKLLKKNEEKTTVHPVIFKINHSIMFYSIYLLLGKRSCWKECSWSSSTLLHCLALLHHMPSHQNCLHIQV